MSVRRYRLGESRAATRDLAGGETGLVIILGRSLGGTGARGWAFACAVSAGREERRLRRLGLADKRELTDLWTSLQPRPCLFCRMEAQARG